MDGIKDSTTPDKSPGSVSRKLTVVYSFNASKLTSVWEGFSLKWYRELFRDRDLGEALINSLILAVLSCAFAVLIGTSGALGMSRRKRKLDDAVAYVSTLPIMIPEIVLGLAFMVIFNVLGVRDNVARLVLAHTTFCIPYVLILVRSRLAGLDPAYEEAARDLGASPMKALFTVTVPLIAPAILSGVFLAFAMSLDDFVISFFVKGAESTTYPVYVYGRVKTSVPPTVNAMCTVMLGVTLLAVALSQLFKTRKR